MSWQEYEQNLKNVEVIYSDVSFLIKNIPSGDISDYPRDCKVYLFYTHGSKKLTDLEKSLSDLGEESKNNLAVGIVSLGDPGYQSLSDCFNFGKLPNIVITGVESFSAMESGIKMPLFYIKMDNKKILNSKSEEVIDIVLNAYNLFLQEKFWEAYNMVDKEEKKIINQQFLAKIKQYATLVGKFIDTHEIEIGITEFIKFKLAKSSNTGEGSKQNSNATSKN